MGQAAWEAVKLPGDVYAGRAAVPSSANNGENIDRVTDLAGLVMGGTYGTAPSGVLGAGPVRGGKPGARNQPPLGAQPESTSSGFGANSAAMSRYSQDDLVRMAADQSSHVAELMGRFGYTLKSEKQSPLSEARYLVFEHPSPPQMSKSGQAQMFRELRDAGFDLGNNPTSAQFQIRIAGHKSGAGGYPASQYEWSLLRDSAENERRITTLMETMQRIAKERPKGGAGPFQNPDSAAAGIGPAGGTMSDILRKYGIAGLAALGGANLPIPDQPAPYLASQ